MLKRAVQKAFRLRTDVPVNFYIAHFFAKYFLRQNREVNWAIHFTSTIYFPDRIVRGKNVFPGDSPNNFIDATNGIEIGDYTNIGPGVGLISGNHDTIDNSIYTQHAPIKIGAFCWLGMNAIVLPGVVLGDFTTVGAGAVVTKSFPKGYCIIGGNPAKILKVLDKDKCEAFRRSKKQVAHK